MIYDSLSKRSPAHQANMFFLHQTDRESKSLLQGVPYGHFPGKEAVHGYRLLFAYHGQYHRWWHLIYLSAYINFESIFAVPVVFQHQQIYGISHIPDEFHLFPHGELANSPESCLYSHQVIHIGHIAWTVTYIHKALSDFYRFPFV